MKRPLLTPGPLEPPRSLDELRVVPAAPGEGRMLKRFIRDHHRLLPNPPAVWTVAFLIKDRSGNVWGVGVWGHPTARMEDQEHTLELLRYALADGLPRNTATWALARMREWIRANLPHVSRLISYQDEEAHRGTIYKADNWRPVYRGREERSPWSKRPGRTVQPRRRKAKWERKP